ncbi:unnamed protein product [Prorocentrum cordatum]|uniref:Uncharacterized protein n=1 Tax=Prorocentrum cordatum TaxID=2364126 RepID=A0ABN9VMQ7_9DINO|nr:unnamed protein product [Polarella glacialis]
MTANARTSALIRKWMQVHSICPICVRVLKSVFKNAWREISLPCSAGAELLRKSPIFRARDWWEQYKHAKEYKKPLRLSMVHATGGNFSHWEDVFCDYFGVDWRSVRDGYHSLQEWMRHFGEFSAWICRQWGLPVVGCVRATTEAVVQDYPPPKRLRAKRYTLEELPATHAAINFHDEPINWEAGAGRFIIICDCQPLVDVIMGTSSRTAPTTAASSTVFAPVGQRYSTKASCPTSAVRILSCGGAASSMWKQTT